jgi:hypothetical protein
MARRASLDGRRRSRTSRASRWALTAVLLVVAVFAVNSIVKTSAAGPDAALAYADRVRPVIDRSTRDGAALADLRARATELGRIGLDRTLDRLARQTTAARRDAEMVTAPRSLRADHGLLVTALTTRANAVSMLKTGLAGAFGSGPTDPVTEATYQVGHDLGVADQAYRLFVAGLPEAVGKTLPPSVWVPDENSWARPEIASFVATLRNTTSLAPVHDLALIAVTTDPAPVATENGTDVIPMVKSMHLDVIVANAGNQPEKRVAVEAVTTAPSGIDTGRQFVDLAPGQRQTVAITVKVAAGGSLDLQVRIGPAPGEFNVLDNVKTRQFILR